MLKQRAVLRDKVLFRLLKTKGTAVCEICKKLQYITKNVSGLSEDELCELWYQVKLILVEAQELCTKLHDHNVVPKEYHMIIQLIRIITSMALETMLVKTFIPNVLLEVVTFLHSVILPQTDVYRVKNEISFFLENWWKTNMIMKEKVIINVLKYLIEGAGSSPIFVKRLLDIKSALHLTKGTESEIALLMLIQNKSFLTLDGGRELISYLFTLGESWTINIHNYIKTMLENKERSQIALYADLYAMAWLYGTPVVKKLITENCLQDIIFHALTTQRSSMQRNQLGKNLLIFLKGLHKHQDKEVKNMIYDQYKGVLWKHLKAPGSTVRCNATDILFVAYPMQQISNTRRKIPAYVQEQHSAMTNLLNDRNSEVCIVALRGMSTLLKNRWEAVPISVIEVWLNIMLNHSRKTPSSEVRLSVFFALKEITSNVHSHPTLKQFLPKFANSIYDSNMCVAEASIKLLQYIEKNTEMSYADVVPLPHLLHRLNETTVSPLLQAMVQLLLGEVIPLNVRKIGTVNALIDIGLNNLNAMRKLLLHSNHVIDWNTSVQLIKYVLSMIEKKIGTSCIKRRQSKRLKTSLTVETSNDSRQGKITESESDEHARILLNIVGTLLIAVKRDVETSDDAKQLEMLLSTIATTLPKFYDHFQEPLAKQSVIFMFSLISPSMLSDEVELFNKFLRELRCSDTANDSIPSIIKVLIKWQKVDAILQLLTEIVASTSADVHNGWDNYDGFNSSLRLLTCLLEAEFQYLLLNKYHEKLLKFWETLHVLRIIIEQKCDKKKESNGSVKFNNVILDYFNEYIKLLSLLHKTDVFDTPEHFSQLLDWAQRKVCPHVSKSAKFSVNVLRIIFRNCTLLLKQLYVTPKLCCDIVLLYVRCIQWPYGITFTGDYLTTMIALLQYSKVAYANNECSLLNVIIPNMLSAQMTSLISYPEHVIIAHANELKLLPAAVQKYYSVIDACSKEQNKHIPYMTIMFNTVVSCISQEIARKEKSRAKPANVMKQKLPDLADKILKILLHTKKYQALCVQILQKAITKYTQIDMLSALLIIAKMLKMPIQIPTSQLQEIVLAAKLQNQNQSKGFIDDTIKAVIKAILE